MTAPFHDPHSIDDFRRTVRGHYRAEGRSFPWRETRDPWAILVSEVMLQQTQTHRVAPKYETWMARYPDPSALARAPLTEVLELWSGLGYNRRALALVAAAREIDGSGGGAVPRDEAALLALPGVGPYTARAVRCFAFGEPTVLVETNVRAAVIHHFFAGSERVADSLIEPILEAALDRDDPRSWNWALMDYGSWLKKRVVNPSRKSASYAKQTPFADSHRRVRGAVLKAVGAGRGIGREELAAALPFARERVEKALGELAAEGFVEYEGERVRIMEIRR